MAPEGDYHFGSADDVIPDTLPPADRLAWEQALAILNRLYDGLSEAERSAMQRAIGQRISAARASRRPELKKLDETHAGNSQWFRKAGRPAYCTYVDRFAGNLRGCIDHIPYLQSLGVGLFHPLPLLKCRVGDSDGGFAVSDYRDVEQALGTFGDLVTLADELRKADIALVLDVVCNHTAREHAWARGFVAGDPQYKDFYIRLDSEADVISWSANLHQVFPETAPGNFIYDEDARGWIWTTFYPFQWDLNYANPNVFIEMLDILFYLANAGANGFRLDSATYLWKVKGTACRNLPETHDILRAMKLLVSLVAPSVFFLAEAIEDIAEVIPFFGASAEERECDLAYNNTPMTALWASLAEGRSQIFDAAIQGASQRPEHANWLNYARCHDDIIWPALSSLASPQRQSGWSQFFNGVGGSFADGMAFQAPPGLAPSTCGMAASLCGVGRGPEGLERLKSVYSVIFALDGIPMIYMGDEIALPNDRRFLDQPDRAKEIRWLNRPEMDWNRSATSEEARAMLAHVGMLSAILKTHPEIDASGPSRPRASSESLISFERQGDTVRFLCIANLSSKSQSAPIPAGMTNLFTNESARGSAELAPWQAVWYLGR